MLTLNQFKILNSCTDDVEIFYFPFAEVNYNGQIYLRNQGEGYAQYLDEVDTSIKTEASKIIKDIVYLIERGYLDCWIFDKQLETRTKLKNLSDDELSLYLNYSCKTFDEHIERYDYGPHEFKTTELGLREIDKQVYEKYFNP